MKIIQIGANNGDDHVFNFISENIKELKLAILVEPVPYCLEALKNRYSRFPTVTIENLAITDDPNTFQLPFYYEEGSNYEVSSFNKSHILNHGCSEEKIKFLNVKTKTINSLLEEYKLFDLHVMFIDAEGFDGKIIKSIDLEKYKIENIYFESAHSDGTKKRGVEHMNLVEYLSNSGYDVSDVDGLNSIARIKG